MCFIIWSRTQIQSKVIGHSHEFYATIVPTSKSGQASYCCSLQSSYQTAKQQLDFCHVLLLKYIEFSETGLTVMFWGMPRVIVIACNVYEFMGPHWNELLLLKLLITLFLLKIPSPFLLGRKELRLGFRILYFSTAFLLL